MVSSGGVNAVLVRDNLPELGANLVAALAGLKMNNLTKVRKEKQQTTKKRYFNGKSKNIFQE